MKRFAVAFLTILFAVSCKVGETAEAPKAGTAAGQSYNFVEGEHYKILDLPERDGIIWEVYSAYCPFCASFNSNVVPSIKAVFPDALNTIYFARYGQYGSELAQVLAVMKVSGENKYDMVKNFYFDEIITKHGANISNEGSDPLVNMGLAAGGISREDYETALKTPEVKAVLEDWQELSMLVVKESGGIPALVVRGKYLIALDKISSEQMLLAEIKYLLEK